jgi:hypothetical protein
VHELEVELGKVLSCHESDHPGEMTLDDADEEGAVKDHEFSYQDKTFSQMIRGSHAHGLSANAPSKSHEAQLPTKSPHDSFFTPPE